MGESKPLPKGLSKLSIHAEECAIKELRRLDNKNKCDIYIWRYSKYGEIKRTRCCKSCTHLLNKYNLTDRVYTFEDGKVVKAVIDNPSESLGNMIRNL